MGLVGPNGSGKTTLLRTIAGLLPHEGALALHGREVREWSARELARRLAFVRQTQVLAFEFKVFDFVLLGRSPHRKWLEAYNDDDRALAMKALEDVDLGGFEQRPMATLSGGEQQRARLAQALVQDPRLLLLDEPTAHLDVHHQLDLMERMAAIVASGRTIIAALHDLPLAARYTDRMLILDRGYLAADGHPASVIEPDMLRSVFRVEAEVTRGDPSSLRFVSPL